MVASGWPLQLHTPDFVSSGNRNDSRSQVSQKRFLPLHSRHLKVSHYIAALWSYHVLNVLFRVLYKNQYLCLTKSWTGVKPFVFSGTIPESVAKAERGEEKKPRTIDTVFVPSKPARYSHKYVRCCVNKYFEHYTFGTAQKLKIYSERWKKDVILHQHIWTDSIQQMYDPTAGPFLCPSAEAPPLVSDPPPHCWSSVQEAQMSHRLHLREPIKLKNEKKMTQMACFPHKQHPDCKQR